MRVKLIVFSIFLIYIIGILPVSVSSFTIPKDQYFHILFSKSWYSKYSNYPNSGFTLKGEDLGILQLSDYKYYYYVPSYFALYNWSITGSDNSILVIGVIHYDDYDDAYKYDFNFTVDSGNLYVDGNIVVSGFTWFNFTYIRVNTTHSIVSVITDTGNYSIVMGGFDVMLLSSYDIYLYVDPSFSGFCFKPLNLITIDQPYSDLFIESPQELVYVTFNNDTLIINKVTDLGVYVKHSIDYSNEIIGVSYVGNSIKIYFVDGSTEYLAYTIYPYISHKFTISGVSPIPVKVKPNIPAQEIPEKPNLPEIPNPPEWNNIGGWADYIKNRVIDFFSKVIPSSLSFLKYLLNIGSGLWSMLSIIPIVLTIIFAGLPAILGVYSMILLIHGDFHQIAKLWLFYIEFLKKIVEFLFKIFKGLISVIAKIVDIVTGPLT